MLKNNFKFKDLFNIFFIFQINEILWTFFFNKNIFIWKILYISFLINKIIELPIIIITHIILIYIYIKIYNIKNIIILSCIILSISLITKKIIKKNLFILRPYNIYIEKNNNKKYIPKWIINQWKKKNNSSFPSGHTLFTSYWIITFWKKKKKKINKIIILILILLTLNRIILFLHRSYEIIFSFIINIFLIYIIKKIILYIK